MDIILSQYFYKQFPGFTQFFFDVHLAFVWVTAVAMDISCNCAVSHIHLTHLGGYGLGGRVVVLQPEGWQLDPSLYPAEVSLGKMLCPE